MKRNTDTKTTSVVHRWNEGFDFSVWTSKKIIVFLGAYGSGKSEVAVNTALLMAQRNAAPERRVVLADLDIINPFFRSFDAADVLAEGNVRIIASRFANTNVEVPAVPGEVSAVFDQPDIRAVLDIGGEDMGARIVSVLKDRIAAVPNEILMVVNIHRPFTSSAVAIVRMMRELEEAAGLSVTGIVNNANLLEWTDPADLLAAGMVLKEVTETTGIPVVFAAGIDELFPESWGNRTPDGTPFLRMLRTIRYLDGEAPP
jgi:hypothetical protein